MPFLKNQEIKNDTLTGMAYHIKLMQCVLTSLECLEERMFVKLECLEERMFVK